MYTINITSAEKITVQADGSQLISVAFDVVENREVTADDVAANSELVLGSTANFPVASYAHGFPLETTAEDLQTYFKSWLDTFTSNQSIAQANSANTEANAVADETISTIVGTTITS